MIGIVRHIRTVFQEAVEMAVATGVGQVAQAQCLTGADDFDQRLRVVAIAQFIVEQHRIGALEH